MNMNNKDIGVVVVITPSRWKRSALLALALGIAALGVTGCKESPQSEGGAGVQQYTCSMHPEVVKDAPGDCPKCGMKLVEKH